MQVDLYNGHKLVVVIVVVVIVRTHKYTHTGPTNLPAPLKWSVNIISITHVERFLGINLIILPAIQNE